MSPVRAEVLTIGVDVGGTTTRAGLVDEVGRLVIAQRFSTPRSADAFLDKLCAEIDSHRTSDAAHGRGVHAIGLALPGLVDADRGRLARSVSLPYLEGTPVRDELAARTGVPVTLMTDADAATWGEYCAFLAEPAERIPPSQGGTKQDESLPPSEGGIQGGQSFSPLQGGTQGGRAFVHLRLGTGIACGVVIDGKLQPTGQPRTTHWNVLVVDSGPKAKPCPCGLRGCLETIVSGPALEGRAASTPSPFKGEGWGEGDGTRTQSLNRLEEAFSRNEPAARSIVEEAARALATAISNLKSEIAGRRGTDKPQLVREERDALSVCLGGGVIAALPCLFEELSARWLARGDEAVAIRLARLGDDAGIIGAGLLAKPGTGLPRANSACRA
jgi:glucokinase